MDRHAKCRRLIYSDVAGSIWAQVGVTAELRCNLGLRYGGLVRPCRLFPATPFGPDTSYHYLYLLLNYAIDTCICIRYMIPQYGKNMWQKARRDRFAVMVVLPLPKPKKKLPYEQPTPAVIEERRQGLMEVVVSVLSHARQDADLTQQDIAQALDYTAAIVANIEALRTPISMADAIIWAARCGMEEAELFERVLIELRLRKARKR
jgi:hypothetical protein